MNLLIIALIAVSTLSTFPVRTFGTAVPDTTDAEVIEEPKTLPLSSSADKTPLKNVEIWQEDEREVLIRNERGAKDQNNPGATTTGDCRYTKGPWTECDAKSNQRTRTLTLKKGNEDSCVPTRTIQKKCKKACRYDKGAWSECLTGQMSRTDKLKVTSDSTCQATRVVNKNCNKTKQENKNKERKDKNKQANKNGKNRQ
jgi:pleiotrophin